jgi:hypothetical protein
MGCGVSFTLIKGIYKVQEREECEPMNYYLQHDIQSSQFVNLFTVLIVFAVIPCDYCQLTH